MAEEAVHAIGVKQLPIDSLKPNPHNPRMLFDRADMDILKSSIERVGILVPLGIEIGHLPNPRRSASLDVCTGSGPKENARQRSL